MTELGDHAERIVAWHEARFPNAQMEHVALKLCEEAGEVARAINGVAGFNSATGDGDVLDECADVLIVVAVLVGRWFPEKSLRDAMEAKITMLETKGAHPASAVN